ncbi:MAG: hypothetical protein GX434_04325 [Peptococcaceae bacterium]|nr:hypothetical protein [Peptococcaceae bacterium]
MNKTALCGLGQAAPTAIQTTMGFFPEKYEAKYH